MAARTALGQWLYRVTDSDVWWSFKSSATTVVAALATLFIIGMAFLAPLIAPHTPFDPGSLSLSDGLKPPAWMADGDWSFVLGTDDQGRDVLSSIMYGTRLSLVVGLASVIVSMLIGISLGLVSGYVGGTTDAVIMRIVSRVDSNQTSLFHSNFIGALVMLPVIPFVWTMPDSWLVALLMVGIGVLGSAGHFLLIAGHRIAPAAVLSPFVYTQLIWVVILGYLVFDHVPNGWTMAGAAIVISSGLYLLYRERKLGKTTTSEGVVEGPLE